MREKDIFDKNITNSLCMSDIKEKLIMLAGVPAYVISSITATITGTHPTNPTDTVFIRYSGASSSIGKGPAA